MPKDKPTTLRVDTARERWERLDDAISFTNLILRWPYHAIINIAYELHWHIYDDTINEASPPLALYLCDDVIIGQDGQEVLRLRPIHINTPFEPFLSNIPNLFVRRCVVECLETQHPNYAGKRSLKTGENGLLLATPDNLKEIALYILCAWKLAIKFKENIKDGTDSLTNDFWVEVQTSVKNLIPLAPVFPVIESSNQSFSSTQSNTKKFACSDNSKNTKNKTAKQRAKFFVQQFSLKTDAERLVALEALFDTGFPRFSNAEIGEWLWLDGVLAPKTRKSYGSRLFRQLRETKGKDW